MIKASNVRGRLFAYFIYVTVSSLTLCPRDNLAQARDYFVAADGDNGNPGTLERPFRSIQKAVDCAGAGDTVLVRAGRYRETVSLKGRMGIPGKPITLRNYQDEEVWLDGTDPVVADWRRYRGEIYHAKLSRDVWQLFVGHNVMQNARWPNARWVTPDYRDVWASPEPDSVWHTWRNCALADDKKSRFDRIHDLPHHDINLAATNRSFKGAVVLWNCGIAGIFAKRVLDHEAGSPLLRTEDFRWRKGVEIKIRNQGARYFLECHLNCLDAPGEWHYDAKTRTIYLYGNPGDKAVMGRTREYGLDVSESRCVRISGMNFFACTFLAIGCEDVVLENASLQYLTCYKTMLGITKQTGVTRVDNAKRMTVRNCRFEHSISMAIAGGGIQDFTFENVLLYDICHRGTDPAIGFRNFKNLLVSRVTMSYVGKSDAIITGHPKEESNGVYELIDGSHFGYASSDGCFIESGMPQTRYCWSHDHSKWSYRYDGPIAEYGIDNHLVWWGTSSNQHCCKDGINLSNFTALPSLGTDCTMWDRPNSRLSNSASLEFGIAKSPFGLPPEMARNLWQGDLYTQLRDPRNRDFRPREGSVLIEAGVHVPGITDGYVGKAPDIGAYEYGAQSYWIPGYQAPRASSPVPPNGAAAVKKYADLMWLRSWRAVSHNVYLGTDRAAVAVADKASPEYQGNRKTNIFAPKQPLTEAATYYWRVDAIKESGDTAKGDVWTFHVEDSSPGRLTFEVVEDTFMQKKQPTTPQGKAPELRASSCWEFLFPKPNNLAILLKFHVTGLRGRPQRALLRVFPLRNCREIHVRLVKDNSWHEATTTWSNRPCRNHNTAGIVNGARGGDWCDIDVSTLLRGEGTYTFAVGGDLTIPSKEGDPEKAAKLLVETIRRRPEQERKPEYESVDESEK